MSFKFSSVCENDTNVSIILQGSVNKVGGVKAWPKRQLKNHRTNHNKMKYDRQAMYTNHVHIVPTQHYCHEKELGTLTCKK